MDNKKGGMDRGADGKALATSRRVEKPSLVWSLSVQARQGAIWELVTQKLRAAVHYNKGVESRVTQEWRMSPVLYGTGRLDGQCQHEWAGTSGVGRGEIVAGSRFMSYESASGGQGICRPHQCSSGHEL